jgi:purine-binding chemotaxis protein CheW
MGELTTQLRSAELAAAGEESTQYLTFFLAGERYAIAILDVHEIIEIVQITRVPMTPRYIKGVINLRGNVVPVVDLRARLGRDPAEVTKRSCIILVEVARDSEGDGQVIGMLVDEVNEILEIPPDHLQPPPDFGTDIRTDFIQAMGRVDDQFLVLLDINHVLSVEELAGVQRVAEHAELLPAEAAREEAPRHP